MFKLKELEEWLKLLQLIIFDLHICLSNLERLSRFDYRYEEDARSIGFFSFYEYQQYFIISIQLSKLFDDNNDRQHYNLHKLNKRLQCESYDINFKQKLELNKKAINASTLFVNREDCKVAGERIAVMLSEHTSSISKIKNIRDKVYAHSDKSANSVELLEIQELKSLVSLSAKIYRILSQGILNEEVRFEYIGSWDIDIVIKEISEYMKYKIERIG